MLIRQSHAYFFDHKFIVLYQHNFFFFFVYIHTDIGGGTARERENEEYGQEKREKSILSAFIILALRPCICGYRKVIKSCRIHENIGRLDVVIAFLRRKIN